MLKSLARTFTGMAAVAALAAAGSLAFAQSPEKAPEGHEHMGHMHGQMHDTDTEGEASPIARCQEMVMKRQEAQAMQAAMQAELDKLAAHMNATSGAAQQQAMAELLTKLVEQRGAMQGMMMRMQPMMITHMTQHMQSGDNSEMGDKPGCPMIEKMCADSASSEPDSGDEHSEHH